MISSRITTAIRIVAVTAIVATLNGCRDEAEQRRERVADEAMEKHIAMLTDDRGGSSSEEAYWKVSFADGTILQGQDYWESREYRPLRWFDFRPEGYYETRDNPNRLSVELKVVDGKTEIVLVIGFDEISSLECPEQLDNNRISSPYCPEQLDNSCEITLRNGKTLRGIVNAKKLPRYWFGLDENGQELGYRWCDVKKVVISRDGNDYAGQITLHSHRSFALRKLRQLMRNRDALLDGELTDGRGLRVDPTDITSVRFLHRASNSKTQAVEIRLKDGTVKRLSTDQGLILSGVFQNGTYEGFYCHVMLPNSELDKVITLELIQNGLNPSLPPSPANGHTARPASPARSARTVGSPLR